MLYGCGRALGSCLFHLHREFRKKTLTNLAIAFAQKSASEREIIAKKSFQNLAISLLELFWLKRNSHKLADLVAIEGESDIPERLAKSESIVFMTAHQANWEIPFLVVTQFGKGIGIGRPIRNPWIYRYLLSLREVNGGKIILPKNAVREGLRALKAGQFVGIVADQAFPESNYSYPLFGTRAWTTTMPALLAYRTGSALVVACTRREGCTYRLTACTPLIPDLTRPAKEEVVRLMDEAMGQLQKSIEERPGEWLWQHDRWKQHGLNHVKRTYRYGFILILLPADPTPLLGLLPLLRKIYTNSFLTLMAPQGSKVDLKDAEVLFYTTESGLCVDDYRYQLVLDLYNSPKARRYYLARGAFHALSVADMAKISGEKELERMLTKTLCKGGFSA